MTASDLANLLSDARPAVVRRAQADVSGQVDYTYRRPNRRQFGAGQAPQQLIDAMLGSHIL